jgi:hypothetical protein
MKSKPSILLLILICFLYVHPWQIGRSLNSGRFVIFDISPTSFRFEQSFSDDGGKTWELNWIAVDTRVKE